MPSSEVSSRLEALQPEIAGELNTISAMAREATDPELLSLCAGYVEAALRCQDWSPPERGLSDREQAFIDFTEQFVTSVGTISDDQVSRLLEFSDADQVYGFVHALYVTDMSLRLDMVGKEVLV